MVTIDVNAMLTCYGQIEIPLKSAIEDPLEDVINALYDLAVIVYETAVEEGHAHAVRYSKGRDRDYVLASIRDHLRVKILKLRNS